MQIPFAALFTRLSTHINKNLKSSYLKFSYSETLNNEYIEKIHQMSYSSLSDNGMLKIFSFFNEMIIWNSLKLFPHIHGYLLIFANTEIYVI